MPPTRGPARAAAAGVSACPAGVRLADLLPGAALPDVLFVDDVAALLRCSRWTIERRLDDGTFPVPPLESIDRRLRWSRRCVEEWIADGGRARAARPLRAGRRR